MRQSTTPILCILLLALCGLCAWQWLREVELRTRLAAAEKEAAMGAEELRELDGRVQAANSEILRLTGTLEELRANSIAKSEWEEAREQLRQRDEALNDRTAILERQNQAIVAANGKIAEANQRIQSIAEERDTLAAKLNEMVEKYNRLTGRPQP